MRTTPTRWILGMGLGLSLALSGSGIVSADTEIAHYGVTGRHYLIDSAGYPGASCWYTDQTLTAVSVRPPRVFAKHGADEQMVGWRARLQKQTADGWATVQTSRVRWALASDHNAANFTQRVEFSVPPPWGKAVRVRVDMFWYPVGGGGARSGVEGQAIHEVDLYETHGFGPTFDQHDECVYSAD